MAFARSVPTAYVALVQAQAESYFDELRTGQNLRQGLLDPIEDLKLLSVFIVANIIYGKLSPEMERQLRDMNPRHEALFRHVISGGLVRFSFSRFLSIKANKALISFRTEWHAFYQKAFERALQKSLNAHIIKMYTAVTYKVIRHEQLPNTG